MRGLVYARPEIFLGLAACFILMLDLVLNDAQRRWTGVLATISLLVSAVLVAIEPVTGKIVALGGLFELDRMAQVLKVVMLLTVAILFVYSTDYLARRKILKGEYYVLGLFATPGRHGADLGRQFDHAVLRPRTDVAVFVRHGRLRPRLGDSR